LFLPCLHCLQLSANRYIALSKSTCKIAPQPLQSGLSKSPHPKSLAPPATERSAVMTDEKPSLEMPEHPFSNDQPQSHSPHPMVETTQMAQSSLEAIATDAYLAANLDPNFSQLSRNEYAGNGPVLAPRPVNPDVSQQMSNSNHMGPTSIMQSNPIMGVGHNGTEQIGTKSRRLNRACDACSKRKIKVGPLSCRSLIVLMPM